MLPSLLKATAFARFKERLGTGFSLVGYFLGDEMVAFNTRFRRGAVLESYHMGCDPKRQELSLFRNILYDDIEHAIRIGARSVHFGRTATRVKASVGARAVPLTSGVRALSRTASLIAPFLGVVSNVVAPREELPSCAFRRSE